MDEEWANSFIKFFEYVGEPPTKQHSLDRIDNEKGYQPGNVRWATQKEQCNNKRNNTIISAHGKVQTLSQWSDETGIKSATISARIRLLGWSKEDAVSKPVCLSAKKQVYAFGAAMGVQFTTKE